jgi:hypothetical protein
MFAALLVCLAGSAWANDVEDGYCGIECGDTNDPAYVKAVNDAVAACHGDKACIEDVLGQVD